MTANSESPEAKASHKSIYIKEVQGHQARFLKFIQLTHSATKAAGIMLAAAIVALAIANSGVYEAFLSFWDNEVGIVVGPLLMKLPLEWVIDDVAMAFFFLRRAGNQEIGRAHV